MHTKSDPLLASPPTSSSPPGRSLRSALSPARHPDLAFWLGFLALNALLFAPLYLFNRETNHFLPLSGGHPAQSPAGLLASLTVWRNNLDIFRLNAELLLLMAIWVNIRWVRRRVGRFYRWAVVAVYFGLLGYYIYENIMLTMYQVDPVFYSQFRLALDGVKFIAQNLPLPAAVYLALAVAVVAAIIFLAKLILATLDIVPDRGLSRVSGLLLAFLAVLVILAGYEYDEALASPKMVISSVAYKLRKNVYDSMRVYHEVANFDQAAPYAAYDFTGQSLLKKPDIYLIFVESYGSVLYKRTSFRETYTALLSEFQQQLQEEGWSTASALSEAPVWGGGSWMSYTSALFGMRIDTHPQYLALLDAYQTSDYPDLGYFLKSQGYEYDRLSGLSAELDETQWRRYLDFYGVDRWIRYEDLDYHGSLYGWGPAPPDQYVLNYAQERYLDDVDQPLFLFYITQNSHYPWVPLPEFVGDWRTLNEVTTAENPAVSEPLSILTNRQNYLDAIDYQLRFLTDFILKTGDDDTIFVLIGDHQPQGVSRRDDGFDTPIHIISKDAGFVDSFQEYGFEQGLAVSAPGPVMHHEGLYSLLVRSLLRRYGQGDRVLPEYLPNGIETGRSP